jgi:hypothetical protein
MSVVKSMHSSTSVNVLTVLTTCRSFVIELRQSLSLTLSILSSSHTRWKFLTIRALSNSRGSVLVGSHDIRGLVGKENALIYIGCWNFFSIFVFVIIFGLFLLLICFTFIFYPIDISVEIR